MACYGDKDTLECHMNIRLVTPAPRGSRAGNRASANRWAAILRRLGHRVEVSTDYHGEPADLMVGLHAWRSAQAIARFCRAPVVFTPWGADVLQDAHANAFHHGRTRFLLASVREHANL